jgi:two-component system, OmpR family, alkaline phosphatase synthesis response regulator PhoP
VAKILVVDDDVTVTQLLKMLLTMEGHQPTTINDSNETLDIVSQVHPDLITLDLMMPGLTGLELCELLHSDPRFNHIPVLIVSARDDTESMDKAFRAGARGYITKPFGVDTLTQKIKELTSS